MGYKYFSCFFIKLAALFDIIWHMHCFKAGSDPYGAFTWSCSQGYWIRLAPFSFHGDINPRGTRAGPAKQKGAK